MPITTSAKKALRQSIKRNKLNTFKKLALKKVVKQYKKLVTSKKFEEANNFLQNVYKVIDKTAKSHVIKKGKASRLKSRLAKKLPK